MPQRIVLSWWGSPAQEGRPATLPDSHPGRALATDGAPAPAARHGQSAWLRLRGVAPRAQSARDRLRALPNRRNSPRIDAGAPAAVLGRARSRATLRTRILAALPPIPTPGVLVALAVGDQRAIPPDQWQVFTRTGVNQLMSISGLHVTMVSGLVFALVYRPLAALPAARDAAARAEGGGARRTRHGFRLCAARRLRRAGAAHGVHAVRGRRGGVAGSWWSRHPRCWPPRC